MLKTISKTAIKTNNHNKMWGKSTKAHKSLGLTLSVTGDTEPIRVCKTNESDGHYVILSGHSRFELAQGPEVECKYLGVLNEEQQILRLIAYNAGHSTHPEKLTAAARYCHENFPSIPITSIMDAAGIVDGRDEWKEALMLSIKATEEASKAHKKRTSDTMEKASSKGPVALQDAAKRSLSKSGTKVAEGEKSPVEKTDSNSIPEKELVAENSPNSTGDFLVADPVPAIKETQNASIVSGDMKTLRKKFLEEYKALTRKYQGTLPEGAAHEASSFLIQFLSGENTEQAEALSAAILQKKLEEEREMRLSIGKSLNKIEAGVKRLIASAIANEAENFKKHGYLAINLNSVADLFKAEFLLDKVELAPQDIQDKVDSVKLTADF
jgi:hypothetical protein